ncbi:MAG: beta strand repeat-containing protein, partial [Gaiellaceae bacterium]
MLPSISLSGGAIAVAGAVSDTTNTIGSTVSANITGATVKSNGGDVLVSARFDGVIHAETLAVAIAAGIGVATAVVHAVSTINGSTQGFLGTGADVTANYGTVTVRALSNTVATGKLEGGSGTIGVAVTSVNGTAQIAATTKASIADDATVHAGALTVQTDSPTEQTTRSVNAEISAGTGGIVGVTAVEAVATITGDIEASIGKQAHITTSGVTTVRAKASSTANAKAGGGTGGLVAVGVFTARAEIGTTGTPVNLGAFVGEGATLDVGGLTVEALDASSSTGTMSSGGGGGVNVGAGGSKAVVNTSVTARVGPVDTATLTEATSITSTGTIGLNAQTAKSAIATTTSGGGGVVDVNEMNAKSYVYGSVTALIGDNTSIPKATGVNVSAETVGAPAGATVSIGSGGGIDIAGTDAVAESTPSTTAAIGNSVRIGDLTDPDAANPITGDVTVTATGRGEADATGTASGGGVIRVGSPNATATVTPSVDAHIGKTTPTTLSTVIVTTGSIKVKSELKKTGAVAPDDNIQAVDVVGDTLTFSYPSINEGDVVQYHTDGTVIPGLHNDSVYTVLDAGANLIRLGSLFSVSGIDPTHDTITFPTGHGFQSGDCVFYDARGAGSIFPSWQTGDASGGSACNNTDPNRKVYFVRVIDTTTIKLTTTSIAATAADDAPFTSTGIVIDANGSHVRFTTVPAGFVDGQAVVYRAPTVVAANPTGCNPAPSPINQCIHPASTTAPFVTGFVDVTLDQQSDGSFAPHTVKDANNNPVIVHDATQKNIFIPDNTFQNGDAVLYLVLNGIAIGGLQDHHTYYVHKLANGQIQLALDYCHAVGGVADPANCTDDHGTSDTADDTPIPVQVIPLTVTPGRDNDLHSLQRSLGTANDAVAGLEDGGVYYVVNSYLSDNTKPANTIQLSRTRGGTPIALVNTHRAGPHDFGLETVDLEIPSTTLAAAVPAGATTLAAGSNVNDTNIKVASVTGFAKGQTIKIGSGALAESAVISNVGTAGSGGTGITLAAALANAHASGVAVAGPPPVVTATLAANATGPTNIRVSTVTGFAAGQTITIGSGTDLETVTIQSVGTAGAGGTGITLTSALTTAHALGSTVAGPGGTATLAVAVSLTSNIKVDSVDGFAVGQTIVVGSGSTSETAVIQNIGTAGAAGTGITLTAALTASHAAGSSVVQGVNIKVTSTSGLAVGDQIVIDTGLSREVRTIQFIGTAGALGTGITLTAPLTFAHASGALVLGSGSATGQEALYVDLKPVTPNGTTTLAAAAAAAAATTLAATALPFFNNNIKVASVTGFAVNQAILIGSEFAIIQSIGTAGADGTGITLASPLFQPHAAGESVVQLPIITVASASNLHAGDMILIGSGPFQESRVIQRISGTNVALTLPLAFSHSAGESISDTGSASKLRAPDGSPLSALRPPAGDGKSGAFAGGGSGGALDFAFPKATLSGSATVTATLAAKTLDARASVELSAISAFDVSSSGDAAGGGGLSVGRDDSSTDMGDSPTTATVATGTSIRAAHDITILAKNDHTLSSTARAVGGGAISGKVAYTSVKVDNDVTISVGGDTSIVGDGNVTMHVDSSTTAYTDAETYSVAIGSGADSDRFNSSRGITIGSAGDHADRAIEIGAGAVVKGNTLSLLAQTTKADLTAIAHATAFSPILFGVAVALAYASVNVYSDTRVHVAGGAPRSLLTGVEGVDIEATSDGLKVRRDSYALAVAFPVPAPEAKNKGHDSFSSKVDLDESVTVFAGAGILNPPDSAGLQVALFAYAHNGSANRDGSDDGSDSTAPILWDADVVILGGTNGNPLLVVGADGRVKAINAVQLLRDATTAVAGCTAPSAATYTPSLGDCVDPDGNGSYTIASIGNSGYGDIIFRTDDVADNDSNGDTDSNDPVANDQATGVSPDRWPIFDMRDNLTTVTIVDYSSLTMRVGRIDLINDLLGGDATVEIDPDDAATIKFDVHSSVAPSLIAIEKFGTGGIVLTNDLNNPSGLTLITDTATGDIGAATGVTPRITTNILDTQTAAGSIGSSSGRIEVDLIQFIDLARVDGPTCSGSPCDTLLTPKLLARAAGATSDVYLSLRGVDRVPVTSEATFGISNTEIDIPIDLVDAGRDIDLVLRTGVRQPGRSTASGVIVIVENEGAPFGPPSGHRVFMHFRAPLNSDSGTAFHDLAAYPSAATSLAAATAAGASVIKVVSVEGFAAGQSIVLDTGDAAETAVIATVGTPGPSGTGITLTAPLTKAHGSGRQVSLGSPTEIDSVYFFALRNELLERELEPVGDTGVSGYKITIEHGQFVTGGAPAGFGTPGLVAGRHIRVKDSEGALDATGLAPDGGSATRISIIGFTNLADDGTGWIDVDVNGSVALWEISGDMRVGLIRSRKSDVLLIAAVAIFDSNPADADPATYHKMSATDPQDVQGDNITLFAIAGSIGTEGDFLETNLDDAIGTTGVLNATAALGAYIYETANDLRIGLVLAAQDETSQTNPQHVTDASLVTRDGSILDGSDGIGDADTDVVAIRIDLKAGGTGGIGVPENDLEINSSTVGFASGRLFAEAGGSIYITETENELVLLAAKALTGNVRLTVPDTNGIRGPPFPTDLNTGNATPEDLDLLVCGANTAMCRSLVAERDPRVAAPSTTSSRGTLSGIWAKQNVYLWVGDDINEPATSEIVAAGTIYIHGDATRSNTVDASDPALDVPDEPTTRIDAGWGTNMHFAGRVGGVFDPALLGGTDSTDKTDLTLIFGNFDVDYFDFDHTYLGAKTRVFGSDNEIAQDAGPAGDG